jgi:hypothetical protein
MRPIAWIAAFGVMLSSTSARAGNSDEVNGGLDVTLTGGAVVAVTYTGAALWYNPAGIARTTKASLELTGVTLQLQIVKVPGLLTIDTDPQAKSEGKTVNFSVIPQAVTFTIGLRENLKLGVGLFNSSIRRTFITEQVATEPDVTPQARAVGDRNSTIDFFHVSGGLAGTFGKKQKLLLGGVRKQTGFGLQLKAGIQWVPIPEVRIGLSVASRTFAFAILERLASDFGQSPPVGTALPSGDPNAQASGGSATGSLSPHLPRPL